MSVDDDIYDDDYEEEASAEEAAGGGSPAKAEESGIRNWLSGRRGWVTIISLTLVQGVFALIMHALRSDAKPVRENQQETIRDLAIDMLGHQVEIKQIYQALPAAGGRRMTIGLDIVLVLGQLPEERVDGTLRPTPAEMEMFMTAINDMEPRIRSKVNQLLQGIPRAEYGSVEVYDTIKTNVRDYINDALDGLDFGKNLRKGIGKRRVTEVLLPMFIRQTM